MKRVDTVVLVLIVFTAVVLRVHKLTEVPPSLYWDEASLGYNAYALLTSGIDEHGEKYPTARFIAFGDYKPPGYIYAIVPFYKIFGVNEFSVRFPSAFSGILMVFLAYFLGKHIAQKDSVGLIAAGLLAISPWSLQLSRVAFEAHLAALFNGVAIYLFLLSLRKKLLLPLSFILFTLAFYTFNANRILSPLIILLLTIIYIRELWSMKRWYVMATVISLILLVPSITFLQSRESRLRFHEVSIFTSLDTIKKANAHISLTGNSWWASILYNRRVYFLRDFMSHYFDHFKGEFLFVKGDQNPRLSTQNAGELYLFELPLLIAGLYTVLKWRSKYTLLLFGWMLLAPIPAAAARETPHMLRIASILPTYQLFSAVGAVFLWKWLRTQKQLIRYVLKGMFGFLIGLNLAYYFHYYWVHYPLDWSGEWQYGYKQMIQKASVLENNYDLINVTSALGRPYIYFLFYNQVDPNVYLANRRAERDWYGLWNVYGFGKYDFTETNPRVGTRVLKIDTSGTFRNSGTKIDEVRAPNGSVVFEIGEP